MSKKILERKNKISQKKILLRKIPINDQEEYIKNLIELYEREKESRCCFQLERDKLAQMREIERNRFEDLKSKLFEAHEKLADFEKWHNEVILNLNKKIKYLIGERDIRLNELKLNLEINDKINFKLSLEERNSYLNDIRSSLQKLNEDRLNLDEALKNSILTNENKISEIKNEYLEATNSIQKACETRFLKEKENFFLINRNAIHEITELKNSQLNEMRKIKDKSYDDLRNYFKDLIQNLMNLIQNLTAKNEAYSRSLKDLESKYEHVEKEFTLINHENEKLKIENKSLSTKSILYSKNIKIFQRKNLEYNDLSKKYSELDLKYEALFQTYEYKKKENERLHSYIETLVEQFKQKLEYLNYISIKKQELNLNVDNPL